MRFAMFVLCVVFCALLPGCISYTELHVQGGPVTGPDGKEHDAVVVTKSGHLPFGQLKTTTEVVDGGRTTLVSPRGAE